MAYRSTTWPSVVGVVETSSVNLSRSIGLTHLNTYLPRIEYSYYVDGAQYKTNRIWFGWFGDTTKKEAEKWVSQYRDGKYVDVFYNPRNPGQAVLKPVIIEALVPLLLASLFLTFVVGVAIFIFYTFFR